MDERRGLQRVVGAFVPQVAGGKLAEFSVYKRGQPVEGLLVTVGPFYQELGHLMGGEHKSRMT